MKQNRFFTFEGLDGAGKDVQMFAFAKALKCGCTYFKGDKHKPIWITNEPTMLTEPGKTINELKQTDTVSLEDATKNFILDRKLHTFQYINPRLQEGHVISSRYDLSSYMFQGAQGASFSWMYNQHEYYVVGGARVPDLTIVIDVPVDVVMQRIAKRKDKKEFFETKEMQEKARHYLREVINFLQDYDGRNIIVIDGNKSAREVTRELLDVASRHVKYF